MKSLASDSIKSNKLKGHHETGNAECIGRTPEHLYRKLKEFISKKQAFEKINVTAKQLFASFKVVCRIAKCKRPHLTRESLVLPVAIYVAKIIMLNESYAKELQKIPPADNTMGRRI
jgi:hypothetical protein